MRLNNVFYGFTEAEPGFPPSYKYVRQLQGGPGTHSRLDRIAQASSATMQRGRALSMLPKRHSLGLGGNTRDKEEQRASGSGKAGKDKVWSSKDSKEATDAAALLDKPDRGSHDLPASPGKRPSPDLPASPGKRPSPDLPHAASTAAASGTAGAAGEEGAAVAPRREYDSEKARVPSWCDRVLWRSPPGPWGLTGDSRSGDCDEITVSDHAPIFTALELEVRICDVYVYICVCRSRARCPCCTAPTLRCPCCMHAARACALCMHTARALPQVPVLPPQPTLHHCTLYLSKLSLYRCRPPERANTSSAVAGRPSHSGYTSNPNLTERSACGKGVPLSVAGAKLQNLPANLQASVYLLPLNRLMTHAPIFSTMLGANGTAVSNVVIGPMLAEREYLSTQHLHLHVASLSGSKPSQIGQAAISLVQAARGAAFDFDVVVERLGVPAGFNLRGSVMIVYTKSLQAWDGCSTSRQQLGQGGTARHSFSNALPRINSFRPAANSAGLPMSSTTSQHAECRHPF